MVAMLWSLRDDVCGAALGDSAPQIAEYWAGRARQSPAIARALETTLGSGGVLAGLAVHAPLLLAVFAHHVAPAVARRRAAMLDTEPPAPPQFAPPGPIVVQPAPVGTLPDDAAAAAAAWVDPADELPNAGDVFDPTVGRWVDPSVPRYDPSDPDANPWDSAHEAAAQAVANAEPFGIAGWPGDGVDANT